MSSIEGCLANSVCTSGVDSITSTACREQIYGYCTGLNDDSNDWILRWWVPQGSFGGTCLSATSQHLYAFDNNPCYTTDLSDSCTPVESSGNVNISTWLWSKQVIQDAITNYENSGYNLFARPGDIGYTRFNETIYKLCCSQPSLCNDVLNNYCEKFTEERITRNPRLKNFCGCHLSSQVYQEYSKKYNIEPQCSSYCNGSDVIQATNPYGNPIPCEQNVCLIDDTSITIANDSAQDIRFEQLCGFSTKGEVSCVITDSVVEIINSEVGGIIYPVIQQCSYISTNVDGTSVNVDYVDLPDIRLYERQQQRKETFQGGVVTLIIGGILIIVALLIYFIGIKKSKKGNVETRR